MLIYLVEHARLLVTLLTELLQNIALYGNKVRSSAYPVYLFGQATGSVPRMALAFVRGDRRINEVALSRELTATWLRPAEDEELSAAGLHAGYIGPRDLPAGVDIDIKL